MSLLATRAQNFRVRAALDKHEYRVSEYGVFDYFVSQNSAMGGIVTEELIQKARISMGRSIEVPVINYDSTISIGDTYSVTIADSENTSALVTLSFTPLTFGFTQVQSLFMNNEIGAQEDFNVKLKKYLIALAGQLDVLGAAALNTSKTQLLPDTLGRYEFEDDILVSSYANRVNLLGDLDPMINANDYKGPIHIIGNQGVRSLINNLAENGLYNSENKAMGQLAGKTFGFSNRVGSFTGKYAAGYALTGGSVGFLARYERECVLGTKSPTGHEWGIENMPIVNFPLGTYYYAGVGDYSAIAGAASADMKRVMKDHFGFSLEACFVTPYNSSPSTIPSPIVKFSINTAATDADSTAPTVSGVVSSAVTGVTVNFSEPIAINQGGDLLTGDVTDLFDITAATPAGVSITSATANASGTQVVFVVVDASSNLADNDDISFNIPVYDGKGNALASLKVTQINAGGTAWEAPS